MYSIQCCTHFFGQTANRNQDIGQLFVQLRLIGVVVDLIVILWL